MKIEWVVSRANTSMLKIEGDYIGSLVWYTPHEVWCWFSINNVHNTNTTDLEEAKNTAFAMWALNQ